MSPWHNARAALLLCTRGETIVPRLERGLGYIALGPADAAMSFAESAAASGKPYLWVTERNPEAAPAGGLVVRLSTVTEAPDALDPKRLQELRPRTAEFLAGAADGLVLLDSLEYLVLHNGAERVQRALADLHDEVVMHGGCLVVFVNAHIANPRLVAWLQRELDPLPVEPGAPLGEGMPA